MGFLSPYKVLDLSDARGMIAGRMLADLGADVVQVEPPSGSTARGIAPRHPDGHGSYFFDVYAANKRGVMIDLETDDGRQLFKELAAQADILFESEKPGLMAERGLDYSDLQAINPGLIYVSITPFGRTGPKADWAASDLTVWAAGGPLNPHRDGGRPPVRITVPQAFLQAGTDAAAGALFALHARTRTGRGQHVDVSAQASLGIATLGQVLADAVGDAHPEWEQTPRLDQSGSGSATAPSQKKWPCRDGFIEFHIGVGPASGGFTGAFMTWMVEEGFGDSSLLAIDWRALPTKMRDGSFTSADMESIRKTVANFILSKTKREILLAATDRKLLCVPIYDTSDVAQSEQLSDRQYWAVLGDEDRRQRMPGQFAQVNTRAFELNRPAPKIGEHNAEILQEWLTPAEAGHTALRNPTLEESTT